MEVIRGGAEAAQYAVSDTLESWKSEVAENAQDNPRDKTMRRWLVRRARSMICLVCALLP
jgi:hypothetical protein